MRNTPLISNTKPSPAIAPRWLKQLVIVVLVLGILFRFYNPGHKVYWFDETMTSLRISGYTQEQLAAEVLNQPPITIQDFLARYQYPSDRRTWNDTLNALATHPEHSPLYYLMARGWLHLFGHSIGTLRLLSAVIGIFAIPAAYWLGWELFQSATAGWAIAALVAISPFHVLYAQEARQYSLWTVAILLSSAALLWAMRRSPPQISQSPRSPQTSRSAWLAWSVYGVTMALGLYSHVFYGFICFSHGLYVVLVEKGRLTRRVLGYAWAVVLGTVLFAPWLAVMLGNLDQLVGNTVNMTQNREGSLPLFWLLNLSRVFFDLNQGPSAINPAHYLLLWLCGYGIWHLYRKAPLTATIFLGTLVGVTAIALMGTDVLLGGRRSSIARYPIPCYLGLQVVVGYLLASKLTDRATRHPKRWQRGAIALAVAGVLSIGVNAHHALWWNKSYAVSRYNPATADVMNESDRPLVITDRDPSEVLALTHLLHPQVSLQLIAHPDIPHLPPGMEGITPEIDRDRYSDLYLYKPSPRLRRRVERQGFTVTELDEDGWLWQVTDRNANETSTLPPPSSPTASLAPSRNLRSMTL